MTILIINGPNLNFLGIREPSIYGSRTYEDLETVLHKEAATLNIAIEIRQTNFEGIIIDLLQYAHHKPFDAILLNAGALSHYSYAIYDAVLSITVPVYEIHLTDPKTRAEPFRHQSVLESVVTKTFKGHGFESYLEALRHIAKDVNP